MHSGSFCPYFSPNKRELYPKASKRKVLNSIFYILITGCRWCDLPKGEQWGARSTSHRWLEIWKQDGTFERIKPFSISWGF